MDTGESAKISVDTIAQGMSMLRLTCGEYACVRSHVAHKAAGAAQHPAFPAPSSLWRTWFLAKTRTCRVAGMRSHAFRLFDKFNRPCRRRSLFPAAEEALHGGDDRR